MVYFLKNPSTWKKEFFKIKVFALYTSIILHSTLKKKWNWFLFTFVEIYLYATTMCNMYVLTWSFFFTHSNSPFYIGGSSRNVLTCSWFVDPLFLPKQSSNHLPSCTWRCFKNFSSKFENHVFPGNEEQVSASIAFSFRRV